MEEERATKNSGTAGSTLQESRVFSQLISLRENAVLFNLIGARCLALASAVVQVYLSLPPERSSWTKCNSGVVCLIKDYSERSYFLRLYRVKQKGKLAWEQELYTQFEYSAPHPYFHTFLGDVSTPPITSQYEYPAPHPYFHTFLGDVSTPPITSQYEYSAPHPYFHTFLGDVSTPPITSQYEYPAPHPYFHTFLGDYF
ncbi:wiskott-Aldrich syndrome protein [Polyodon spathula]|uniref:wiskott-Aldrich syndrome protein n=1 Tax=Polyodon spathula TaxID=7913 RepID=UPI001B7DE98B|nr:wiskott-Aldrich syndrome protein [Polyodon spathula]